MVKAKYPNIQKIQFNQILRRIWTEMPEQERDKYQTKHTKQTILSFPRMAPPVLSLSSLASLVVLAKDLDTRELPRHLHRQMEDYRRLQGSFTMRGLDFEVQRMDGGEVREVDRAAAWQYFLRRVVGKIMMEFEVEVKMATENSWNVSWPAELQKVANRENRTTVWTLGKLDFVHSNITREYNFTAQHHINVHSAKYLENGMIRIVEKIEEHRPENGMTLINEEITSFKIDESDCMFIVQQFRMPLLGLAFISTTKSPRAQDCGDNEISFKFEDKWNMTTLLSMVQYCTPVL